MVGGAAVTNVNQPDEVYEETKLYISSPTEEEPTYSKLISRLCSVRFVYIRKKT